MVSVVRELGLGGPVIHGLGHRVTGRGLQPSARFGLEFLELVPDLGLGPSGYLAPDPRTVRAPAERDRTHPGAVRRVPVDRTFAVPRRAGVAITRTVAPSLALVLALLRRPQDRIRPLTCGAKGTRTPGLLDANQTLFQLSYSPRISPQGYLLPSAPRWNTRLVAALPFGGKGPLLEQAGQAAVG
jgi:hypothetical protein